MTDSVARILITGDSSSYERSVADSATATEDANLRMKASTDSMASHSKGVLGGLSGAFASVLGPNNPISGQLDKLKGKFAEAESGASGFFGKISALAPIAGAAVVVGIGAAIGVAAHLGDQMDELDKKLAGNANASVAYATKIGNAFLGMGGQVMFSGQALISAYTPVAPLLDELYGHLLTTAQAQAFMTQAAIDSQASGESLSNTTKAITGVMVAYKLPLNDTQSVMTQLYNMSRLTGTSQSDLSGMIEKVHGKLGVLAPSLSDTAAMLLTLHQNGESSRQSLTTLAGAETNLLGGSKAVNDALSTQGIHVQDANGKFVGWSSVIDQVSKSQANMTNAQKLANDETLFGKTQGMQLYGVIADGSGKLQDNKAALDNHKAAVQASAEEMHTLSGEWKTITAQVKDLATRLGEVFAPVLKSVGKLFIETTQFVLSHKGALEVLAAVVGGVLVGAVVALTVAMAPMIASLALVAAPFIGIGLAIAGVVAAVILLAANWSTVWGAIKDAAEAAWHFIDNNVIQPIESAFKTAIDFIKNNWQTIGEILTGPVGLVLMVWQHFHDDIINFFKDAADQVKGVWDDVVSFFTGLPDKIIKGLGDLGSLLYNGGKDIVSGLIKGIGDAWGDVWNFIKGKLGDLMHNVLNFFGIGSPSKLFAEIGGNLMKGMAVGIGDHAATAQTAMSAAAASLVPSLGVGLSSASSSASSGGGSSTSSSGSSAPMIVQLIVDGTKFAEATFPNFQTVILQQGRYGKTIQARLQ